jgi:hypothetical protein
VGQGDLPLTITACAPKLWRYEANTISRIPSFSFINEAGNCTLVVETGALLLATGV